jgi:hypothetical protein
MSEQNEVLSKNLKVDIQFRDRTYSPKYRSGRTTSSLDVQSKVWQGTLFYSTIQKLQFSYFKVVLVKLRLIEGFP